MTKGQRAMAVAKIYPEPETGGRGKKRLGDLTVSAERLSLARTVLQYAPDLADNVLSGSAPRGAESSSLEMPRLDPTRARPRPLTPPPDRAQGRCRA